MEKILLFFMQGIPEIMGVVAFGLALARVPLRWGIITVAGTALTIIIFIIRSLPLSSFGLHTVAATLLLALFIMKTTRTTQVNSFVAAFASFTTLVMLELVINKSFFFITKLDQQVFVSNYLLWRLVSLPQAILMILFAVIISKFKKPDKDAWKIRLGMGGGEML
ncbi:hypothetical protein L9W92_01135 [Pelotomaculum terephthalicicum JT]|uniref:hypothetical protein n=1 Tax=Pelotomaculum terephthalicicum TaxID=206393 RepID=UPI001F0374CB|nr:hypothetical protein [Pelotomaculum terephthalicicum]MCG9966660.1 hypothetical protein [Pelotomaculum terephthalicicum JT]